MKNEFILFKSKDTLSSLQYSQLKYAHDALYIYNYREENIKKLILAAKNLDRNALKTLAQILYISICAHFTQRSIGNESIARTNHSTLILHAPSSSFALAKKPGDHMALVLNLLSDLNYESKEYRSLRIKIDIAPSACIHTKPPLTSQHIKNRISRLADMRAKFQLIYQIPPLLLTQYRYIYIVDDVLTTGSTLQSLKQTLMQYCAEHDIYPSIHTLAVCH